MTTRVLLHFLAAVSSYLMMNQQPLAQAQEAEIIPFERIHPAEIKTIRQSCNGLACRSVHAVIFVHGIFGGEETFQNGQFDWRENLPPLIDGSAIDVYSVTYKTQLFHWLGKNVASLDEVVYALYHGLQSQVGGGKSFVERLPYKSIGFIGHSLGGNISTAYLHTVKTERGHDERARHGYIITLGAPTTGAQIADVAIWLKERLGMRQDALLESLRRDNTFLRMLAHWRYSESRKASNFRCREVRLFMAREGATMYGIPIVPDLRPADFAFSASQPPKIFEGVNHEQLAKPASKDDPIYMWVDGILKSEITRINRWAPERPTQRPGGLCSILT